MSFPKGDGPRPGDRVRVTFDADFLADDMGDRMVDVADGMGPIHVVLPSWATVEVLERALCAEIEGATGIRCQQPQGHVGGHKGTTTDAQTATVGYPLFVSWPAEAEPPARRSVRVPNEPHGIPLGIRQQAAELLTSGNKRGAVGVLAAAMGISETEALAYVEDMEEYQVYLSKRDEKVRRFRYFTRTNHYLHRITPSGEVQYRNAVGGWVTVLPGSYLTVAVLESQWDETDVEPIGGVS